MKLLEQVRHAARVKHYAIRTEDAYAYWIERYIRFHHIQHPGNMGAAEVEAFLTDLAAGWLVFCGSKTRPMRNR